MRQRLGSDYVVRGGRILLRESYQDTDTGEVQTQERPYMDVPEGVNAQDETVLTQSQVDTLEQLEDQAEVPPPPPQPETQYSDQAPPVRPQAPQAPAGFGASSRMPNPNLGALTGQPNTYAGQPGFGNQGPTPQASQMPYGPNPYYNQFGGPTPGAGNGGQGMAQQYQQMQNPQAPAGFGGNAVTPLGRQGQGAGAAPPVPGAPSFGSAFQQNALYDPENAPVAVQNVLRDIGANPFNPGDLFSRFIMRAAPGLGLAFMAQQARQNLDPTSDSVLNSGNAFKNWLTTGFRGGGVGSALGGVGGGGGGGSLLGQMAAEASGLKSLVPSLRAMFQSENADANAVNPYAQRLADLLAQDMGGGTTDFLASMLTPMMGRGLGQGYARGLQQAQSNAVRGYANSVKDLEAPPPGRDIWTYLLGI